MKRILLLTTITLFSIAAIGQSHRLKGDGQIFWEEHFNWENPADEKGWTAPEGWLIEDFADNGFTWMWTKDSLKGPFSKRDGGFILNSTTRENGYLAIDMDYNNAGVGYMDMAYVNSSITMPVMDFSSHPSVIVQVQQLFKYLNTPKMAISVSNDNGAHWADFDMKMGTSGGSITQNLKNDQVAHFAANISDVAAGQPQVTIKITWSGSILYFWMIDDITFSEAWDNDLQMRYAQAQMIEENTETGTGFLYMMPKSQLLPIGMFEGSVINNGEIEQTNVYFQTEIKKNGVSKFKEQSNTVPYVYFGDAADTLSITSTYTPEDYGHYEMTMSIEADDADQVPDNNIRSAYFHVTDSVFARTPDVSEADESTWRNYQNTHEGDLLATEYNPTADCVASSISAYISKANIDADFRFVLLEISQEGEAQPTSVELLTSNLISVDSTLLKEGWVTIELTQDGQGEFMKAGKRYLAAVQFWTYITTENLINRKNAFWVGSTRETYPGSSDKQWSYLSTSDQWSHGSSYSKMIRLNIDNHENIVDGIPTTDLALAMDQNYPNPFRTETLVNYSLNREAAVSVEITDITGKMVQYIDAGSKPAGQHTLTITNPNLDAGIYFYTLNAGGTKITKRMVVAH